MFDEQTLKGFLEARKDATEIIKHETPKRRELSLEEALALQIVSHLLTEGEEDTFYPVQVARFLHYREDRTMYNVLTRLQEAGLFTVHTETHEEAIEHHGKPRHIFTPTRLGAKILILFQREER